jgi:hypothetical protein
MTLRERSARLIFDPGFGWKKELLMNLCARPFALSVLFAFAAAGVQAQQPPYSGTIFNFPNSFKDTDSSVLTGVTYAGQQRKSVYDRRAGMTTINAYVYTATFSDGAAPWSIMVNPEFSQDEAKTLAEKYARSIGQIPHCIRSGLTGAVIHDGVNPWGGGDPLTIHHGQGLAYERQGIVTETMIHESTHAGFDRQYYTADWAAAARADGNYISTYARDNPTREDHSESFLCWLVIRYKKDRIPAADYTKINAAIPNRIKWYDSKNFKLSPVIAGTTTIAPAKPRAGTGSIAGTGYRIGPRIFDLQGRFLGSPSREKKGAGGFPIPGR